VSTRSTDNVAGRRPSQTAPSALRAGWISIGLVVAMFSAIILATQPDDEPVKADIGTSAAEQPIPIALRVIANIVGWEQNRHN
jgi:hypothetical protein